MDDLLLPQACRLIHIGPHKTGSTALQSAFHQSRDRLATHGVRYAGSDVRPLKAGWAIGLQGRHQGAGRPPMERWHELMEDVMRGGDLRVCISNEDFGRAQPDQIRQIVDDLGGEEPHVVAVARRLDRYLASQWQERIKAGKTFGFEDWLRRIFSRPDEPAGWDRSAPGYDWERTNVWYAHDTEALVRRWTDVVGTDRFTLIISDGRDRELLPRTFEQMLGLPTGLIEPAADQSNRSLSWGEAEFVRALNEALSDREVPPATQRRLVTWGLVRDLMVQPVDARSRSTPPFPQWAVERIRELSASRVEAIENLGVRVVGDLASLTPGEIAVGDPQYPPGIPGATAARAVDWVIAELFADVAQPAHEVPRSGATPTTIAARIRSVIRRHR